MVTGEFTEPTPTLGVNFEKIRIGDAQFDVFDLGGHEIYRQTIWENYIKLSYGFVFVVDSTDKTSIHLAREEFWKSVDIKESDDEFLILFLCNKSDLKESMDLETMVKELDLYKLAKIPNASYQFFKVSMKTGENYHYAMDWLHNKAAKLIEKREINPLMFLIAQREGLPILSIDRTEVQHDPYLISGFLSAVKGFATEVFREDGVMQFTMSDKHKYIISATEKSIYATLIGINESQEEARRIMDVIKEYHEETKNYEALEIFIARAFKLDMQKYKVNREY